MRRIFYTIIIIIFLIWAVITSIIEYKIKRVLENFSNDKIKISYEKINIGLGFHKFVAVSLNDLKVVYKGHDKSQIYNLGKVDIIFHFFENRCEIQISENTSKYLQDITYVRAKPKLEITVNLENNLFDKWINQKRIVNSIYIPKTLIELSKNDITNYEVNISTDLKFSEEESGLKIIPNLLFETPNEKLFLGGNIYLKLREESKNYYLSRTQPIVKAEIMKEDVLAIAGDIEFFRDQFPLGSLSIDLANINKLLSSDFISPRLSSKIQKILQQIEKKKYGKDTSHLDHLEFKIDFTNDRINIEGLNLEKLKGE